MTGENDDQKSVQNPESHPLTQAEITVLKDQVQTQDVSVVITEFVGNALQAREVKRLLDDSVRARTEPKLQGQREDLQSEAGKAVSVKQVVAKVLINAQADKIKRTPQETRLPETPFFESTVKKLSEHVKLENLTDYNAPYIYDLLHKMMTGNIKTAEELKRAFDEITPTIKHIDTVIHDQLVKFVEDVSGKQQQREKSEQQDSKMEDLHKMSLEDFSALPLNFFADLEAKQRKDLADLSHQKQQIILSRIQDILPDFFLKIRSYARIGSEKEYSPNMADKVIRGLLFGFSSANEKEDLKKYDFSPYEEKLLLNLSPIYHTLSRELVREKRRHYLDNPESPEFFELFKSKGIKKFLDSEGKLTEKGKRTLKREALKYLNTLLANVDANPDTEFNQSYSDLREGYGYWALESELIEASKDEDLKEASPHHYKEIREFIEKGIIEELSRERHLRELFHNISIWIKTLDDPKKIAEHIGRYNISEISSVALSDVSGVIISKAMAEYERYLQYGIAMNNGEFPVSLFSGKVDPMKLYYEIGDRTNLEERLISTIEGLKKYVQNLRPEEKQKYEEQYKEQGFRQFDIEGIEEWESDKAHNWELQRAIKYAKGLHLMFTLRGYEALASSRPPEGYNGSAEGFMGMVARFNPNFHWVLGERGGKRLTHTPALYLTEYIVKKPKQSLWERITETFDPAHIAERAQEWNEGKMAESWDKIKDSWLYSDVTFRKILSKFGLGGLATRGPGWRFMGFQADTFFQYVSRIQEALEANVKVNMGVGYELKDDWVTTYKALTKIVGAGSCFFFDGKRAVDFVKNELNKIKKPIFEEKKKLWFDYTEGKNGADEIFTVDGKTYTATELLEMKTLVLRGMNFFTLLKRSPLDFLNNLVTLSPEILSKDLGGNYKDYCFEFDLKGEEIDKHALASRVQKGMVGEKEDDIKSEIEKAYKMQVNLKRVWGVENTKHLKYLRKFYKKIEEWGRDKGWMKEQVEKKTDGTRETKLVLDAKKVKEEFFRTMELAVEKVKFRNAGEMSPEDIDDAELSNIFFNENEGEKGLIPYFRNLNEDFGIGVDKEDENIKDISLGGRGFFYHMARGWQEELCQNFHPNTSDVDWRYLLHEYGSKAGEDTSKRLWAHLGGWNEVITKIADFEHMLDQAAVSGKLDEIKKLMWALHNLEGVTSPHEVHEQQYYLTQLVIRYFQENSTAELPFFFGSVYKMLNKGNLSLSQIRTGKKDAFTFTPDGANAFIQELMHSGILPKEGIWSGYRLMKAMSVDWSKNLVKEIIPNISLTVLLYLLYKFIGKSLEEVGGGKK